MKNKEFGKQTPSNYEQINDTFEAYNLKPDLIRGIYVDGMIRPSHIQTKALLSLLERKDTIIHDLSGRGKTIAYLISVLQLIDTDSQKCQALVLTPTRELACSAQKLLQNLAFYLKVSAYAVLGINTKDDVVKLKEGIQVVIGTPGRIYDMIKKEILKIEDLNIFVLDEADEIFARGFQDYIQRIITMIDDIVQICLCSATLPSEILNFAKDFMIDPVILRGKRPDKTLDGIKQYYINTEKEEWKLKTLMKSFRALEAGQYLVYCNTNRQIKRVAASLRENGIMSSEIHGDIELYKRDLALREFRTGAARCLVTSDLQFKAPESSNARIVINYDLPHTKESYLQRIGRNGRFDPRGVAISFITPADSQFLQEIEKFYDTTILELPDISEIY